MSDHSGDTGIPKMKASVKIWFQNFAFINLEKVIVQQRTSIFVSYAFMISLDNVNFIISVIDKYSNKFLHLLPYS